MDRTQRLALLAVAVAIAVAAIVLVPGTDEDSDEPPATIAPPAQTEPAATAPSTQTQTQARPAEPAPPLLRAGSEREIRVDEGDTVRFRVRHDSAEEVHVHGYDITRDIEPGRTATISFEADIPGIFEIELEHSGTPLGTLRVEP